MAMQKYRYTIDDAMKEAQKNELRATKAHTLHFFSLRQLLHAPTKIPQTQFSEHPLRALRNNGTMFSPHELCSFQLQSLPDLFARFLRLVDGALVKRPIDAC